MNFTTYYINNIPIYVRRMPSGDITVWHPYNLKLAEIIYPICVGKGYWKPGYNNWIIFSTFANSVIVVIQNLTIKHR